MSKICYVNEVDHHFLPFMNIYTHLLFVCDEAL